MRISYNVIWSSSMHLVEHCKFYLLLVLTAREVKGVSSDITLLVSKIFVHYIICWLLKKIDAVPIYNNNPATYAISTWHKSSYINNLLLKHLSYKGNILNKCKNFKHSTNKAEFIHNENIPTTSWQENPY